MASKYDVVTKTLGAAVGAGGSFTVAYPTGRTAEDYLGSTDHMITSQSYHTLFAASGDFTVTPGPSTISITLNTGLAMAIGSILYINLDRAEVSPSEADAVTLANPGKMTLMTPVKITLGAPATADPDGYIESQNLTSAGVFSVSVTAAAALLAAALDGVADVPRNVVAAWTGTAVLTVTGTDEYGNVVVESSASGTSLTGKKAFKTVTNIAVSANVTSLTVGTGVVLGLPVFLADAADVTKEILDGVAATAGTIAAAILTTPSATTGDVRGTYNPNSAPNGTRVFELGVWVRNPSYTGAAQFAG